MYIYFDYIPLLVWISAVSSERAEKTAKIQAILIPLFNN